MVAAALLVLALALGAAACTGSGGTDPGTLSSAGSSGGETGIVPGKTALRWHACTGSLAGSGLECTRLKVPASYAKPRGRKITLALSMLPATAPKSQQQGIMLVNPGGPGGSGLSLPQDVASSLPVAVAAGYDIVGFDPRGVGASLPALSCEPSFFDGVRADYIPSGPAAEQALVKRAKRYAADCGKRYGWLLRDMTTQDSARDMDSIRQAFRVRQVSYAGFSYGTYLGQVYGTLFPARVRRMVLDSTVDPDGVWWADNIAQDYAFQKRMEAFFAWAARHDSNFQLGSTATQVQDDWYRARTMLKARPATSGGKPVLGGDEFDDTFLYAGYSNVLWPGLARALSDYLGSGGTNTGGLISQWQANGQQNENEFAVYSAVQCSDVNWPRSWQYWNAATVQVNKTAPFQAWDNAWYNASCAFWPVKGPAKPLEPNGRGLPPILMLQPELDAATPYAGALNALRHLPSARMVVLAGDGNHAQLPVPSCAEHYLDSYLASGALPAGNVSCQASQEPSPEG